MPGNHPLGMATSFDEGEGADGVGSVEVGVQLHPGKSLKILLSEVTRVEMHCAQWTVTF